MGMTASCGNSFASYKNDIVLVPDKRSRILEVIIVRRLIYLGTGNLEWGGNGEGLRKGRSVYEQPGTEVDRILSQQGGFPSK